MKKIATTVPGQADPLYRAVWRWHFYAGMFVIPFLLMLSLSGMLMLLSKPIEPLLHKELILVEQEGETLSASRQLALVKEQFPGAAVQLYIPPRTNTESAQFSLVAHSAGGHGGHNAPSTTVYVNPYSGEILGTLDPAKTIYARLQTFHGSLFLGDLGDSLIEIAAGLAVLMVLSGLYLAWPREGWRTLIPRPILSKREDWRRFHRIIGLLVTLPLLLFLLSGLAWTNIWGGKLVQAWSSLPGTRFEAPVVSEMHQSMNQPGLHQVPWVMEQTPLPISEPGSGELDLDKVNRIALKQGFINYRVHLPQDEQGVWTISSTSIAGDLTNPFTERTVHIDRVSGEVLADLKFADYPIVGKAMAAFIPLHQGDLGGWNLALNLLLCALVIFMIASGITLWWKRRPDRERKFSAPVAPPSVSRAVVALMFVISLCFPLSAAAIFGIIILDWLILSRFELL